MQWYSMRLVCIAGYFLNCSFNLPQSIGKMQVVCCWPSLHPISYRHWSSPTSVWGYLRALTCSLQAEAKDVVQAIGDIDVVLATSLKEVRNTIDQQHDAWFQEIALMCRSVDVFPTISRRCARQRHMNDVPADDHRTY